MQGSVFCRALLWGPLLLLPVELGAQGARTPTGSVTGRVVCADTNAPARMASVALVPVVDTSFPAPIPANNGEVLFSHEPETHLIETGLDGSFVIRGVRPGNYYLVAEKAGYLRPMAVISREQMNKPDVDTTKLMERLLTPVNVSANHATQVEARIYRGAALSGTVRFDDGTPVIGAAVRVLSRGKDGKWTPLYARPAQEFRQESTDDQGRFRIAGLPGREYLLAVTIELSDFYVDHLFGGEGGTSNHPRYSMDAFYGDAYRARDAKKIKVGEGEEVSGLDIMVRLADMHAVSGTVVEAGSGKVVNAAHVSLLWKDDRSLLVATDVQPDDNGFHFEYVPQGEYILRVEHAKEVIRTEVPTCKAEDHCTPPTRLEEKLVRRFGEAEQPLAAQTDLQAVVVPVPPATASAATAASQ